MPAEIITRSAGYTVPSEVFTPSALPSPVISSTPAPSETTAPALIAAALRRAEPFASNCLPIIAGAASIIVTFFPALINSHAASRPKIPPPITATLLTLPRLSLILLASASFLITSTPSLSAPLIGGLLHSAPAAYMSLSYFLVSPLSKVICLLSLSMTVTLTPRVVFILFSSYQSSCFVKKLRASNSESMPFVSIGLL